MQAPLACRNFIQLSLEGGYDNTLVTRVVKDFMVQMGDPSGSGWGGASVWGKAFKDEFHGRLKFSHRGQVAMANENRPNTNHAQFLITLDKAEWLDRKHTIFGKVTGDTIFNVLRMGEVETGLEDRPVDEIRVLSVEVLWNPFDDIEPRTLAIKPVAQAAVKDQGKDKRKAVKDTKVLSFGDEEEEAAPQGFKKHSAHESKQRGGRLRAEADPELEQLVRAPETAVEREAERGYEERLQRNVRERLQSRRTQRADSDAEEDENEGGEGGEKQGRALEAHRLREGILRSRRAVKVLLGEGAERAEQESSFQSMSGPLEAMRLKCVLAVCCARLDADLCVGTRSGKRSTETARQRCVLDCSRWRADVAVQTLARLSTFAASIRSEKTSAVSVREAPVYSGQVLEGDSGGEEPLEDWHQGKLRFRRQVGDGRADDVVVVDSRGESA